MKINGKITSAIGLVMILGGMALFASNHWVIGLITYFIGVGLLTWGFYHWDKEKNENKQDNNQPAQE